jgi:hypothetical protein
VLESEDGVFDGRNVRVLKRLAVHEVSPVLVGAGVNTRTLATKAAAVLSPEDVVVHEFAKFVQWELAQDMAAELREIRDRHDEQELLRAIARQMGVRHG